MDKQNILGRVLTKANNQQQVLSQDVENIKQSLNNEEKSILLKVLEEHFTLIPISSSKSDKNNLVYQFKV